MVSYFMSIQFNIVDGEGNSQWPLILWISCLESVPGVRTLFYFPMDGKASANFKKPDKTASTGFYLALIHA